MDKDINFWSIVTSRFFLLIAVAALAVVGIGIAKGIIRYIELDKEISKIERDISELESKNQELNSLIAYFSTPEFKEKVARLQLNLQKPGERIVIIPESNKATGSEAALITVNNETINQESNWRKWLNYFFP